MKIKIPVGRDNFDAIRENGSYYVDKTEILYELLEETDNQVSLFTRPRRFGKTLMLSMIESFLDIRRDSRKNFEGLAVMGHEDFCRRWLNQYPVLFITLKDIEALSFQKAYAMLKVVLAELCIRHEYLAKSEKVSRADVDMFERLMFKKADEEEVRTSLATLMRMMHAHYGRPAILLIDENDVPLAKANEEKEGGERYYPQMLEVIRGLLSTALKSDNDLKLAVITGCLRIAKESIFTGVNNFASYSVLDEDFSGYFGFTQDEVDTLLALSDCSEKKDLIKEWYDGYVFGSREVYCPWDVTSYVATLIKRKNARPKNYWKNTSGNAILREFIELEESRVKKKFEVLMNGGSITQSVSDQLTYSSLYESEDNLWSVLVMTGYLTKADIEEEGDTVSLRIPNREIATIFHDTVERFFAAHLDTDRQRSMMEALWTGDEETASQIISDLLWQTISYMDYHEDYYHAFLAGIFVGRGYEVESNKEKGLGRPDIQLIDHDERRILIIEAKKSDSREQMEADCKKALQQIVDQEYARGLDEYTVLCYGISFFQKRALVRKLA